MAAATPLPSTAAGEPIGDINTTPLIDVMLVLLIMLIITIPMATHKVPVDLPQGVPDVPLSDFRNRVSVTADDRVLWNGSEVSETALPGLLGRVAGAPLPAELQFAHDPEAHYEVVARVITTIKRANVAAFGIVGNERYAGF